MTKSELREQVESLTDDEAANVRLVYAPDWPSRVTSIEEVRKRLGARAMSEKQGTEFWRENAEHFQPADGEG